MPFASHGFGFGGRLSYQVQTPAIRAIVTARPQPNPLARKNTFFQPPIPMTSPYNAFTAVSLASIKAFTLRIGLLVSVPSVGSTRLSKLLNTLYVSDPKSAFTDASATEKFSYHSKVGWYSVCFR